jgi:hypothetical protein
LDPTVLGGKLASGLVAPLLKKLFSPDGPGAGLVDKPVRLAALVSFRGEKRTLTEPDVHKLAARIVAQAVDSPDRWPLQVAYLSLEATGAEQPGAPDGPPGDHAAAAPVRLPAEKALRTLADRLPGLRTLTVARFERKEPVVSYAEFFPTAEIIRI